MWPHLVRLWGQRVLFCLSAALLLFISFVSCDHLLAVWDGFGLSVKQFGLVCWAEFFLLILYLSHSFRRQTALIFLLFFCIGFWQGPFLEPPADPFAHLDRIYSSCEKNVNQMPRVNMGVVHYSMAGNLLCSNTTQTDPEAILRRIDITHGLFLGILMSGLFILSRRAGLVDRWAFFSCLTAFLFMGTNRFSYFTYYSLAPSATSLVIYWLWTAVFFFRRDWRGNLAGVGMALLCFPILWVNHRQEAVFLGFLVIVWLLLNASYFVLQLQGKQCELKLQHAVSAYWSVLGMKILFFSSLCAVLVILPQAEKFTTFASHYFVRDFWQDNQGAVVSWHGIYLWGKVWSLRVNETLGGIGVATAALAIPFFWPGVIRIRTERKVRIYILALLPFLGYCIPLFHFIWLSNVKWAEYYRLCYSSMFWLLFAAFFQGCQGRLWLWFNNMKKRFAH